MTQEVQLLEESQETPAIKCKCWGYHRDL